MGKCPPDSPRGQVLTLSAPARGANIGFIMAESCWSPHLLVPLSGNGQGRGAGGDAGAGRGQDKVHWCPQMVVIGYV